MWSRLLVSSTPTWSLSSSPSSSVPSGVWEASKSGECQATPEQTWAPQTSPPTAPPTLTEIPPRQDGQWWQPTVCWSLTRPTLTAAGSRGREHSSPARTTVLVVSYTQHINIIKHTFLFKVNFPVVSGTLNNLKVLLLKPDTLHINIDQRLWWLLRQAGLPCWLPAEGPVCSQSWQDWGWWELPGWAWCQWWSAGVLSAVSQSRVSAVPSSSTVEDWYVHSPVSITDIKHPFVVHLSQKGQMINYEIKFHNTILMFNGKHKRIKNILW